MTLTARYLTPADVEAGHNIKQKTLDNWRSQGKGPQYVKRGRIIRYRREDVEKWLEAGRTLTFGLAFETF